MSKTTNKLLVLVLAAALLLAFSLPALSATTMRVLTGWPKTSFDSAHFMKFLAAVQKEADAKYPGELKVDYKGAGEVVHNRQQVEALRNGLVDLVLTATSYYTSIMPEMDSMAVTPKTPWEERAAGVNDYLETLHNQKANAHYLGRFGTGTYFHMFLNTNVKGIEGFKGLRVRASPTNIPFMKALGIDPVGMPPTEVFTAMERGVVKGYVLPPATIRDFGLVPVSKYMVDPGFYQPCKIVLANLDFWKKLPDHLKKLITEQYIAFERTSIKVNQDHYNSEIESFKKGGLKLIKMEGAERDKFSKMAIDALMGVVKKKAPAEAAKLRELLFK